MVLGPKMRMRGHLNLSMVPVSCTAGSVREMKLHQGPSLHLAGYSLWNEFAMKTMLKKRGHGSGAEKHLSALGVAASENRIPMGIISSNVPFWEGPFRLLARKQDP